MVGTSHQDHGGRRRRKSSRRNFAYPAKLHFGRGSPSPCIIVDISDSGAQLEVRAGTDVPDEFFLLIGGHASVRRRCLMVWRSTSRIGVRFQGEPQKVPQQVTDWVALRAQVPSVPKKKRA